MTESGRRSSTASYEPGEVLHQSLLAKTIGISTTPLREALRRLKSEGLVELDAHRDARVSQLTAEEARDLLEVRLSLDPLAASLGGAAAHQGGHPRDAGDVAAREAAAEQPERPRPVPRTELSIRRSTRPRTTSLLITTLGALWDKADRYRRLGLEVVRSQEERDQKDREHAALFDAVVAGDGDTAHK